MSTTKPIILDESFKAKMDTATAELHKIALAIGGETHVSTWEEIKIVTRAGKAKQALQVGQEFTVGDLAIPAQVVGFIEDGRSGSIKIKDSNLTNGVIFQFKDCVSSLQFDSAEAFYYAENGLAAGTYNFTIGSTYSSWLSGTYQFTLANAVPAGGQLALSGNVGTSLLSLKVNVYASRSATSYSEQATITSGNAGTALGTFGTELNHSHRVSYGNNRWKHSAIRQMLNSNAVAGSVWTPQHGWDRPPSWVASQKGFMNGLPSTFTDYVVPVELNTYKNTVTDGGGLDTTDELFFLPGRNEVFMTQQGADDGVAWSYYKDNSISQTAHDAADPIRIKKYNNSATYWWLRSPSVGDACGVYYVVPTGAYSLISAFSSLGIAPAFVIA